MHVDRKKARRGEGKEGSAGSISTSASVLKSEKKGSKKNSKDNNSKYKLSYKPSKINLSYILCTIFPFL